MRHLNTDSDSEVLLNIFAHELGKQKAILPSKKTFFSGCEKNSHKMSRGICSSSFNNWVWFGCLQDPRGIRPLVIGEKMESQKKNISLPLKMQPSQPLGFKTLRDVEPGEAIYIDVDGNLHSEQCSRRIKINTMYF